MAKTQNVTNETKTGSEALSAKIAEANETDARELLAVIPGIEEGLLEKAKAHCNKREWGLGGFLNRCIYKELDRSK